VIALNRCQGRPASDGGMFGAIEDELGVEFDPDAQPILARVGANICPWSTIDITDHALRVTAVALDAKRHPKTRFAKATL
jgi:hypothetical protein